MFLKPWGRKLLFYLIDTLCNNFRALFCISDVRAVNNVRFHLKILKIQHDYFYQKNSDLEKTSKIYPRVLFIVALCTIF